MNGTGRLILQEYGRPVFKYSSKKPEIALKLRLRSNRTHKIHDCHCIQDDVGDHNDAHQSEMVAHVSPRRFERFLVVESYGFLDAVGKTQVEIVYKKQHDRSDHHYSDDGRSGAVHKFSHFGIAAHGQHRFHHGHHDTDGQQRESGDDEAEDGEKKRPFTGRIPVAPHILIHLQSAVAGLLGELII